MLKQTAVRRTFIYVFLTLFAAINVIPLLWMVMNSFKSEAEYAFSPFGFPEQLHWENFSRAWEIANLGVYFWNSIMVTLISIITTVFFGSLASYFLARFQFKAAKWLQGLFLLGMLVPIHATLIPIFLIMQKLGLLDTHLALVLPYTAFHLSITIFILIGFMSSFPKDIEESAIMDGAGVFGIFFKIILPMTRPALATVIILNFIYNWNEYLFALVLINDTDLKTLPIGLASFAGKETANYTLQMAALTITLIPIVLFYLALEKQLVKGMTAGAVKG